MAHAIDLSNQDILAYLNAHEHKDLLRFITCGSVDDGKSTLIGRLLYESKLVYEDQLAALDADSRKHGTQGEELDLALLVDGLAAEREQGITIDVAYRFFSTEKRKFIVADTPGHEQYTRNMVTGASTADLAVILVDARKGVLTQTRRHSYIVSLLGIRHVVLAVNKMDAVGYSEDDVQRHRCRYLPFARQLGLENIVGIPVSALQGRQHPGQQPRHALVSRPDADAAPGDRGGGGARAACAAAPARAVGESPQPGLPRLRRADRQRPRECGGSHPRTALRRRSARGTHRHLRRRPAPRRRRPVRHADAGSGDRCFARRPARCQRRSRRKSPTSSRRP